MAKKTYQFAITGEVTLEEKKLEPDPGPDPDPKRPLILTSFVVRNDRASARRRTPFRTLTAALCLSALGSQIAPAEEKPPADRTPPSREYYAYVCAESGNGDVPAATRASRDSGKLLPTSRIESAYTWHKRAK